MAFLTVSFTTKEVPNTAGTTFINTSAWQLLIRDASGNVKHTQTAAAPTFAPVDITTFADGNYSVLVSRIGDGGAVAGSVGGTFTVSNTMEVPDVVTLTVA